MAVLHIVHWNLAFVHLCLLSEEVHREGLLKSRVAFVLLIREDALHRCSAPLFLSSGCGNAHLHQLLADAVARLAIQEKPVDVLHDFCLFRIDGRFPVLALGVPEKASIGQMHLASLEAALVAPLDVLGDGPAFFLGKGGHNRQEQFAFAIKGVDVLLLEKDLAPDLLQLAYSIFPSRSLPLLICRFK